MVQFQGSDDCQDGAQQVMAGAGEALFQISALLFPSSLIELL